VSMAWKPAEVAAPETAPGTETGLTAEA